MAATDWGLNADQAANLGLGNNPFLGQNNPYLQANIDAASQDMVNNYNLTQQPAFNAAMAKSGSFGNAGLAQMNSEAQNQLQKNLGNLSNNMRMQDYNQQQGMYQWQQNLLNQQNQWQQQFNKSNEQWDLNFDRGVYNDAYSQNMNNLQVGMGLLNSLYGYNQQDIANANTQQNAPLNYWQQLANQGNAIGQGFGTTTGTTGTTSNPWATMMGGAQIGNALQNYGNQQGWWGNSGYTGAYGSGTNYSGDLANMGASNNWFGTGGNP